MSNELVPRLPETWDGQCPLLSHHKFSENIRKNLLKPLPLTPRSGYRTKNAF